MHAASAANQLWWDADAASYHRAHPEYLASFYWCPEMLHESAAGLLGDTSGAVIVEVGCGSAPCTRWLQDRARLAIGLDISAEMLAHCPDPTVPRLQADALALPLASGCADTVFSAFGAFPFLPDLNPAFAEVARVLRPGGRCVFSVAHPMRWVFADDPTTLQVAHSYFEHAYEEYDDAGTLTYAEYHHSFGDYIRALRGNGMTLIDVLEPTWPAQLSTTWGQWSPQRGAVIPGTAIFIAQKSAQPGD